MKLLLYYEDKGRAANFGLHNLVLSCVADELGADAPYYRRLARTFEAHPCNGRDRLLCECRDNAPDLPGVYACALGVVDGDKLHHNGALGIGAGACKRDVHAAFARAFAPHGRVAIVVIEANTETVVSAACEALQRPLPAAKAINSRDAILNAAADAASRAPRDAIRNAVPSLDRLIRKLACVYMSVIALGSTDE